MSSTAQLFGSFVDASGRPQACIDRTGLTEAIFRVIRYMLMVGGNSRKAAAFEREVVVEEAGEEMK